MTYLNTSNWTQHQVVTTIGTSYFTVPNNFNWNHCQISCLGGGGIGQGTGAAGSGGAFSAQQNVTGLTFNFGPGSLIPMNVGGPNSDTWFGSLLYATAICAAKGGSTGPGVAGGQSSLGIGNILFSGGSSGLRTGSGTGGCGGAAGPYGNGGYGGNGDTNSDNTDGGGGGGADGGGNGSNGTGSGGSFGAGANGGGDGGSGTSGDNSTGEQGFPGSEWSAYGAYGCGGGAGGGGWNGGNGVAGNYGGGGSGGSQGLIIIEWNPIYYPASAILIG